MVEQFAGWQIRERGVKAQIVCRRRASYLSSFYKWAMKNGVVETDPAIWLTSRSGHIAV
jgi:integrase/recombinase XerD